MESKHPTHLLFLEPKNPPSLEPIEDELTKKVDYIFSTLQVTATYRGFHYTPFKVKSDNYNYGHPSFPLVSNSLAPYYARHHRKDISPQEIDWIHKLYEIISNPNYYNIPIQHIYHLRLYQTSVRDYGKPETYILKLKGNVEAVRKVVARTFYEFLSKEDFEKNIQKAYDSFDMELEDCEIAIAYIMPT